MNPLVATAVELTGFTHAEITGRSRAKELCRVRQAIAYVARTKDPQRRISFPIIAKILKRSDHTTVLNAYQRAVELVGVDADFTAMVEVLMNCPQDGIPASLCKKFRKINKRPDEEMNRRHPAVLTRKVKPKNEPVTEDPDAMMRYRGTILLGRAIQAYFDQRAIEAMAEEAFTS